MLKSLGGGGLTILFLLCLLSKQRYIETYLAPYKGYYYTGDAVRRDADGHIWITGRVDDVLNVAGHRIGTAEIEGILDSHEAVAEAAVIGVPHDVKVVMVWFAPLLMRERVDYEMNNNHMSPLIL